MNRSERDSDPTKQPLDVDTLHDILCAAMGASDENTDYARFEMVVSLGDDDIFSEVQVIKAVEWDADEKIFKFVI